MPGSENIIAFNNKRVYIFDQFFIYAYLYMCLYHGNVLKLSDILVREREKKKTQYDKVSGASGQESYPLPGVRALHFEVR